LSEANGRVAERRLKPKRTGKSQSDQAAGKVNCEARECALGQAVLIAKAFGRPKALTRQRRRNKILKC